MPCSRVPSPLAGIPVVRAIVASHAPKPTRREADRAPDASGTARDAIFGAGCNNERSRALTDWGDRMVNVAPQVRPTCVTGSRWTCCQMPRPVKSNWTSPSWEAQRRPLDPRPGAARGVPDESGKASPEAPSSTSPHVSRVAAARFISASRGPIRTRVHRRDQAIAIPASLRLSPGTTRSDLTRAQPAPCGGSSSHESLVQPETRAKPVLIASQMASAAPQLTFCADIKLPERLRAALCKIRV
jgi:hypothetical protein